MIVKNRILLRVVPLVFRRTRSSTVDHHHAGFSVHVCNNALSIKFC